MRQIPKRLNNDGPGSMIIREGLKPVAEMLAYTSSERDDTAAEFIERWNAFEPGGEVERLRKALRSIAQSDQPMGMLMTFPAEECDSAACAALRYTAHAALAQEPPHA